MLTLVAGSKQLAPPLAIVCVWLSPQGAEPGSERPCDGSVNRPFGRAGTSLGAAMTKAYPRRQGHRGFTLLELLVVLAIMAMATAGVTLAFRDHGDMALEREAQRLAALFESARAQSRASGVAVRWHTTSGGFLFEGLPLADLPTKWMNDGITVRGTPNILLGPEPIVGAQAVDLIQGQPPLRSIRIATDGLRPFVIQAAEEP